MAGIRLGIDPTGMETGGKRAESALEKVKNEARSTEDVVDRSAGRMGASFNRFSTMAVRALSGAVAGFVSFNAAAGSVNLARDFNASLAETSTLIAGTDAEMTQLSASARSLATDFGGTATAQVQAFYQAISAGAGSVEEAATLLDSANKLAIGGATDVTTAVDGLTTATNAYAASGLTAAQASDALFVGIKAGKTTAAELSAGLGNIVPLASAVGVSFDEVVSATAALTTQGQSTSVAITGLRQVIAGVVKPTDEATKLADKLGLAFDAQALKSQGLAGFLEQVIQKTGGSQEAMAQLFGSVEALNAVLAFAGGAGQTFADINVQMKSKAGAAQEAYDKMAASLDQRWTRATAAAFDIALTFGNTLLAFVVPALEKTAATLTAMSSAFAWLSNVKAGFDILGRATDSVTLAMGDQIRQANALFTLMGNGNTMTQTAALVKLSEAEAHIRSAAAIRDETRAIVDQQVAALELRRINTQSAIDSLAAPGTDLAQMSAQMRSAYEEQEQVLVRIIQDQQSLLDLVRPLDQEFSAAAKEVDRIREAIRNATDGVVVFDGEVVTAVELTDRLGSLADGVNFDSATSSAQALADWLGIALSNAIALSATTPTMADEDLLMSQPVIPGAGQREANRSALENYKRLTQPKPARASSGGGGGASDIDKTKEAYDSLLGTLDPVVRASQEFEQAQKTINEALKSGKIDANEASKAYNLARERFEEATASANTMKARWDEFSTIGGSAIDRLIDRTGSWKDVLKGTIKELVMAHSKAQLLANVKGGSASDSFGGLIFKGLFGGFFDAGGTIPMGQTGIVGERDVEAVTSTPMGAVVTSRQDTARKMDRKKSGGAMMINIDARGAQEGVAQQIASALQAAAPQIAGMGFDMVKTNWGSLNQEFAVNGDFAT